MAVSPFDGINRIRFKGSHFSDSQPRYLKTGSPENFVATVYYILRQITHAKARGLPIQFGDEILLPEASVCANETVLNGLIGREDHAKPLETVRKTIGVPDHRAEATVLMRSLRVTPHLLNHTRANGRAELTLSGRC